MLNSSVYLKCIGLKIFKCEPFCPIIIIITTAELQYYDKSKFGWSLQQFDEAEIERWKSDKNGKKMGFTDKNVKKMEFTEKR